MKFETRYLFIAAALPMSVAATGDSHVIASEAAPKVSAVNGTELRRALPIVSRFLNDKPAACFDVLFSTWSGQLRVDFAVKDGLPPRLRVKCGITKGFVLNEKGGIVRTIYSR